MKESKTIIIKGNKYSYPSPEEWFRPSENYPEYRFKKHLALEENHVYEMVRESFYRMGLDCENYGTSKWNPLKGLVKSGDKVVIKPNLVIEDNASGHGTECLYTQPSVVAPVIDYVLLALDGNGEIIVGDAPIQKCDFDRLVVTSGYDKLIQFYSGKTENVKVSLVDFRELKTKMVGNVSHQEICDKNNGIMVQLGKNSEFYGKTEEYYRKLRVTSYNPYIMMKHHNTKNHDYYINKNILEADVIINMPKPKTHRKAGVTIALKNIVGINSRKEYLPHHTMGSKMDGGDEYLRPSTAKKIKSILCDKRNIAVSEGKYLKAKWYRYVIGAIGLFINYTQKDQYYEGSWYGNDTISKTIADLNKIIFYADKNGKLQKTRQRNYLIIADMIVSGEGEGPLMPSEKKVGIIAAGDNPVYFDKVIAKIMGADVSKLPSIVRAEFPKKGNMELKNYGSGIVLSNDKRWNHKTFDMIGKEDRIIYKPTEGWRKVWEKNK